MANEKAVSQVGVDGLRSKNRQESWSFGVWRNPSMSDQSQTSLHPSGVTPPQGGLLSKFGWEWWMTCGVITGLLLTAIVSQYFLKYDPERRKAWSTVEPHLVETAKATEDAQDPSVKIVRAFFDRQRGNARAFAGDMLSWGGKWAYAKGLIYNGSHEQFVQECFRKHLFSSEELSSTIQTSVDRLVNEIQSQENQLLVKIQADLSGSDLAKPQYLPALADPERLRNVYDDMLIQVLPIVSRDMGITVSREMASFVDGEIASVIVIEIGASLASSFGISGGILGVGAGTGIATFGVGLVAAIIVDMGLDWVMSQRGYDPESQIAKQVIATLDTCESYILSGKPGAYQRYENAKWNARWDFRSERRELAKEKARAIEKSGDLGLRHHLRRLHEVRARLREEALKTLILKRADQ